MACGPWQIAIVLLGVILLFGAKRLPEIARSLGRSASEFRRGQREVVLPPPVPCSRGRACTACGIVAHSREMGAILIR